MEMECEVKVIFAMTKAITMWDGGGGNTQSMILVSHQKVGLLKWPCVD